MPDGLYDSSWDSVTPMTGKYTTHFWLKTSGNRRGLASVAGRIVWRKEREKESAREKEKHTSHARRELARCQGRLGGRILWLLCVERSGAKCD